MRILSLLAICLATVVVEVASQQPVRTAEEADSAHAVVTQDMTAAEIQRRCEEARENVVEATANAVQASLNVESARARVAQAAGNVADATSRVERTAHQDVQIDASLNIRSPTSEARRQRPLDRSLPPALVSTSLMEREVKHDVDRVSEIVDSAPHKSGELNCRIVGPKPGP